MAFITKVVMSSRCKATVMSKILEGARFWVQSAHPNWNMINISAKIWWGHVPNSPYILAALAMSSSATIDM